MIKTILKWFLALLIIALIVVFFWTGGPGKVWHTAASYTNLIDVIFFHGTWTGDSFRLPWQPNLSSLGAPFPNPQSGNSDTGELSVQEQYAALENNYDTLSEQAVAAKTFGNPSPLRGQVHILNTYGATANNPDGEYLSIRADTGNTAPISLAGWSLQSAYTGIRSYIPPAASFFMMGIVNNQDNVYLDPGASAIITSGPSPVGVSFRDNMCTGYLAQFQNFYPPLTNACPAAEDSLPLTPENLRAYGETCFDFLKNVPLCTSPFRTVPTSVSPNCRDFVVNTISYNGCVDKNRYHSSFTSDSWRIYLNSYTELWRNSHDIIRLLDADGQTVDVYSY